MNVVLKKYHVRSNLNFRNSGNTIVSTLKCFSARNSIISGAFHRSSKRKEQTPLMKLKVAGKAKGGRREAIRRNNTALYGDVVPIASFQTLRSTNVLHFGSKEKHYSNAPFDACTARWA